MSTQQKANTPLASLLRLDVIDIVPLHLWQGILMAASLYCEAYLLSTIYIQDCPTRMMQVKSLVV